MAKQYGMVIDMQKCVGCGACALACKTENSTQGRNRGQTFNWADFYIKEEGTFPNIKAETIPTRCNHCTDPECIKGCPKPQALYKSDEGLTLFNVKYCIQCKKCQEKCPYSALNVDKQNVQYSVISFNEVGVEVNEFYKDKTELIKGCTASGAQVAQAAGATPPNRNEYTFKDDKNPRDPKVTRGKGETKDVRAGGWVEKCTFCVHRIRNNEQPYCVVACPAKARTVGDVNDPASDVSKLIAKYKPRLFKNNKGEYLKAGEKGTQPNNYYIRDYKKV
jgi:Fe-S-cluster-containing dehydrogenase component